MPKSTLALKATITKRPTAESVDQAERQLQAEYHQAAENAATTAQEAPTATPEEPSSKQLKREQNALQLQFLSAHLNRVVTIFTINGIRLVGRLKEFDQFTLLIEGQDGVSSMVFKHCVTTIAPFVRQGTAS